jgi:hypothetical protein
LLVRLALRWAAVALGLAAGASARHRDARAQPAAPPPGPEAGAVTVTLVPASPSLVLGTDKELEVEVEVTGPGAETYVPSRVYATVGALESLLPVAAGAETGKRPAVRFTARYFPPADRFPQVALLVAELSSGASDDAEPSGAAGNPAVVRGMVSVPLFGSTEVPLRTNPAAAVTLRVGDRTFGPVTADMHGHVKIPVEVPPGIRMGTARAVDRAGNLRETDVDLQPNPFRRVLIIAPDALEVGSFTEVAVLAVDPAGVLVPPARISLRASDGLVHPLGGARPGEARFLVEAPRRVGPGTLALTAVAAGTPLGRADLALPLNTGRPHVITLSPSTRRLVVGGRGEARVVVSAHDQFGNPTSAEGAVATVDGQPVPLEIWPGGQGLIRVPAPARYLGVGTIMVDVALAGARDSQEIRLTGGEPTGLTLEVGETRLVADGTRSTELRVHAVDKNGTPTMIPGLSWEAPGGRIRRVRIPREGEYVADFVPERAHDLHREPVAVTASEVLRADASVEVVPPPARLYSAARAGLFSNLTRGVGPAIFVEGLVPVRLHGARFSAGVALGYMHEGASLPLSGGGAAHLTIDQLPILALLRYPLPRLTRPEIAIEAAVGMSVARTFITSGAPADVQAGAQGVAGEIGAEAALPFRPGRLVAGLRYLWISLGRTSHADELEGNSAGLLADVGYRISF